MKTFLMKSTAILACCISLFLADIQAQDEGVSDEELYVKKNIAVTELSRLGVNIKQYAQSVKSLNVLDADKTARTVMIGKTQFVDDGLAYDLVAGDGILTSKTLFNYTEGETILQAGAYQPTKEDYLLHDELFEHTGRIFPKLIIKCKTRFVHCAQMPYPANQVCSQFGWPYGEIRFYDCEVTLIW